MARRVPAKSSTKRALQMNPVGMQTERDIMPPPAKPKDNPMMIAAMAVAPKKARKK